MYRPPLCVVLLGLNQHVSLTPASHSPCMHGRALRGTSLHCGVFQLSSSLGSKQRQPAHKRLPHLVLVAAAVPGLWCGVQPAALTVLGVSLYV